MAGTCAGQAEALRLDQEVFDRRRVPSRAAAWRAFAHGFQLRGDLLKRAIRCCRLDAGHEPDQPVIAWLRPGSVEQGVLDDPFGSQPPDGAAEPLHRPMAGVVPVEHPDDVTQGWSGRIRGTVGNHESSWAITPSRCAVSRAARTCGSPPGRRFAARDCRRRGHGCARLSGRPWCARRSERARVRRWRPEFAGRTCLAAWWRRWDRAGCGIRCRWLRAARRRPAGGSPNGQADPGGRRPGFRRTGCHAAAGPARAGCGQHRRRAPPARFANDRLQRWPGIRPLCMTYKRQRSETKLDANYSRYGLKVTSRKGGQVSKKALFGDCGNLVGHGLPSFACHIDIGFCRVKRGYLTGDRHDLEPVEQRVGRVVAQDHRRPSLLNLTSQGWIKRNQPDVASTRDGLRHCVAARRQRLRARPRSRALLLSPGPRQLPWRRSRWRGPDR